jgi:hypothetical protein
VNIIQENGIKGTPNTPKVKVNIIQENGIKGTPNTSKLKVNIKQGNGKALLTTKTKGEY